MSATPDFFRVKVFSKTAHAVNQKVVGSFVWKFEMNLKLPIFLVNKLLFRGQKCKKKIF